MDDVFLLGIVSGVFFGGRPCFFGRTLPGRPARARFALRALLAGGFVFSGVGRRLGRFFRRASAGLFLFRFSLCGGLLSVGLLAGPADGLLFFGRRIRGGGLSGAAGFCRLDFFGVLFGKNGILTYVILKNGDATSAFQTSQGDFYAGARKREQGVASGGKGARIGDDRASYALYSC